MTEPAERPWLDRPEWASGRVPEQDEASGGAGVVLLWLFGFLWMGGLSLAFLIIGSPLREENRGPSLVLGAMILSGGLISWGSAIGVARRRLMAGKSYFEMASVPGLIGGALRGDVHTEKPLPALRECAVSLHCVRGRRGGRSGMHSFLWRDELAVLPSEIRTDVAGTWIPVAFEIPFGLPASRALGEVDEITWYLHVLARGRGVRYEASFVVPLFVTDESRAAEEGSLGGSHAPVRRPPGTRIRIDEEARRAVISLPVSRAVVKWIVGPPLIGALVTFAASLVRSAGEPVFPSVWPWALGLAAVPSAFAVADLFFFRPRRIEIADGQVTVSGGVPRRVQETFAAADVREVAFAVGHGIQAKVRGSSCTIAQVPLADQRWLTAELRRLIRWAASQKM
jgi:hypothetical protein